MNWLEALASSVSVKVVCTGGGGHRETLLGKLGWIDQLLWLRHPELEAARTMGVVEPGLTVSGGRRGDQPHQRGDDTPWLRTNEAGQRFVHFECPRCAGARGGRRELHLGWDKAEELTKQLGHSHVYRLDLSRLPGSFRT